MLKRTLMYFSKNCGMYIEFGRLFFDKKINNKINRQESVNKFCVKERDTITFLLCLNQLPRLCGRY
jgi:hypothetical protein